MNNQAFIYNTILFEMVTDQYIISRQLGNRFLQYHINPTWYERVEENHPNAEENDRFLVRRLRRAEYNGRRVIEDYITTKVNYNNYYNGWVRQIVSYFEDEGSPYPFDFDRFHRDPNEINEIYLARQHMPLSSGHLLFHFEH
jgi:hypothetical protein